MKAKNCLIFGGSGQIGRHLIRKLTKNDYRVTVVTRNIHQKSYIIKTQANAGYIDIVEANIFDEEKSKGHYDKNGKSVKKALMKTPINGARLSSPFGMRKHPIDGFNKMHRGTDLLLQWALLLWHLEMV